MKELKDIKKVAVLGAGTMGPGIAQTFAMDGYEVSIYSRSESTLDTAKLIVITNLDTFAEESLVQKDQIGNILNRINFTNSISEAVKGADFIVETIVEKKDAKRELFQELDKLCEPDVIMTSNTSFMNIDEFVPESRECFAASAHWFAPPHITPLVEVCKGKGTTQEVLDVVISLLKKVGKVPVTMEKFIPGFVVNRIQRVLGWETFYLLDNGYITPEQLDLAVKASLMPRGMVLGLCQRYDFTGIDLSAKNLENKDTIDPPMEKHPNCIYDLVEKGHYGVKTGKGFYDYSDKPLEEVLKKRDKMLLQVLKNTKDFIYDRV